MAKRRRKRAPPTYNEKYKDIKDSGWNVDIPKPDTPSGKALVTKYHRIIFGGFTKRNGKQTHTPSLNISYTPYSGKHKEAVKTVYGRRLMPRIKNAYYPKELGNVKGATKKSITFQSKYSRTKIAIVRPQSLYEAGAESKRDGNSDAIRRRLDLLDRNKSYRLMLGPRMMPQTYNYEALIDRIWDIARGDSDKMLQITEVGEFALI